MSSFAIPIACEADQTHPAESRRLIYAGALLMLASILIAEATVVTTWGAIGVAGAAILTALTPIVANLKSVADFKRQLSEAKAERAIDRTTMERQGVMIERQSTLIVNLQTQLVDALRTNLRATQAVGSENRTITANAVTEIKQAMTPGSSDALPTSIDVTIHGAL